MHAHLSFQGTFVCAVQITGGHLRRLTTVGDPGHVHFVAASSASIELGGGYAIEDPAGERVALHVIAINRVTSPPAPTQTILARVVEP